MEDEVDVLISIPVTGTIEYVVWRKKGHEYDIPTQEEVSEALDCGDFTYRTMDPLGIVVSPIDV